MARRTFVRPGAFERLDPPSDPAVVESHSGGIEEEGARAVGDLVGGALVPFLTAGGREVVRLVRRAPKAKDEARWDPEAGEIDSAALEGTDASRRSRPRSRRGEGYHRGGQEERSMPLDHYVTLGRSGLAVSPFCLGAMTFGEDWGWGSSVKESEAILDSYLGRGGNFVDTANAYTRGHSEKIIGDHVGRHPARRHRAVIATKFSSSLFPGDPNAGGSSRKGIVGQCEESLRRLQTDYIDLYWLHVWDPLTPIEETLRALDDLVASGKVRYVGVSDTPAWKVAEAQTVARFRGWAPFVALQIEYSLLERTVEGELVPMALELGLGITPWSPLRSGVLSGKYTRETAKDAKPGRGPWVQAALTERSFALLDVVRRVAGELGTTPARVALAWVQARPGVASTIIGARSVAQLEDNLGALEVRLPAEATAALDEASKPALDFPAEFVRGSGMFKRGGTTVNGETAPPWPLAPKTDAERH